MKKTDWAVVLGTVAYSTLFHHQNAGLNFLLFTLLVIILFVWSNSKLPKLKLWSVFAACSLFSAAFIFVYGSSLAIVANICSLLLLSATSVQPRGSVLINFFQGLYSTAGSIVFLIVNLYSPKRTGDSSVKNQSFKILIYFFSFCVLILFFALYKQANPLFDKYTEAINLKFVTIEWLLFTLGGLILLCSIYKHERVQDIDHWEQRQSQNPVHAPEKVFNPHTRQALTLLFIVVNLMILFIICLDINFLYLRTELPEGITHKQFVHNGVNMLILSILLGISIILYAFRGALNFDDKRSTLKVMVYIWLVLNFVMVFSTALRNQMYIEEALLTYKRIGVFYWLFFAVLGLITTMIKLNQVRPNWYLIRANSFLAVIVLVLSSAVDWDQFVTNYNLRNSKLLASLDKKYLISLSEGNIKQLYQLRNKEGFNIDSVYHYRSGAYSNGAGLDRKLFNFLDDNELGDWRSYNLRRARVKKEISEIAESGLLDSLNLSETYPSSFSPLQSLPGLKEITLPSYWRFTAKNIEDLNKLPILEIIHLFDITEDQIDMLSKLTHLKILYITTKRKEMIEKLNRRMPGLVIRSYQ